MELRVHRYRIRELRQKQALSQDALAELSGLHPRTIQRIEALGIASVQSVRSMARALGVEPGALELAPGVDPAVDQTFRATATIFQGTGAAFLWAALSALVWVPTSQGGMLTAVVALLGFVSFCVGLLFLGEGNRRAALLR